MLNPRIVGQAENAHKPILDRILAGTGTTKNQWVVLTLTATGDAVPAREIAARVADALKIDEDDALAAIGELTAAGLLATTPDARVRQTDRGRARYREIRGGVDEVVARVYGDIPAGDLAVAGRVLTLITERLNAEAARPA